MKLNLPKGWTSKFPIDGDEHAFAGPAAEAKDILAELELYDVAAPELSKYAGDMIELGWLPSEAKKDDTLQTQTIVTLLHGFPQSSPALLRGSLDVAEVKKAKDPRLTAWLARLNWLSTRERHESPYESTRVNVDTLQHIAKMSVHEDGPVRAVKYLRKLGVSVHVTRAIPGTRVDGCAFWCLANRPLIGLSLRYDRLDNFWFSLLHECAHVALHVTGPNQAFADDFSVRDALDDVEIEANFVAADAAIPRAMWKRSEASKWATPANIERIAREAAVHPSIAAGRVRYEKNDYTLFAKLIGQGQVAKLFTP
jgi:HTH-type transcriptional regulator / antitoxin HigA